MSLSNMKFFVAIISLLVLSLNAFNQSIHVINSIPLCNWSGIEKGADLSDEEKLAMLKMLPPSERIEFVMDSWHDEDAVEYWSLDTSGLVYIDLDFDGDLDLLYSGINGNMMQTATKVLYNDNGELNWVLSLPDGILDLKKNANSIDVYTLFMPCCDSYTTRIDHFSFSKFDTAAFQQSISMIGRSYYPFKGMPDFGYEEILQVDSMRIYAMQKDFRGNSGYFRSRNKEVRKTLREEGIIELLNIKQKISFSIIDTLSFKNEIYSLVITEPLNNLPKMPVSLYEWSAGNKRRLIGWIKLENRNEYRN